MLAKLITGVTGPWGLVGLLVAGAIGGGWVVNSFASHRVAKRDVIIATRNAELTTLRAAVEARNVQVAHAAKRTEQLQSDVAVIRAEAESHLAAIGSMQERFDKARGELTRDAIAARQETVACRVELVTALNSIRAAVRGAKQ